MPEIDPVNLPAQLAYRARGNSPVTQLLSAIANCFPGLEFDFRAVWKRIFEGLELHESANLVVGVEAGSAAAQQGIVAGDQLVSVAGQQIVTQVTGPAQVGGPIITLTTSNLEWTNVLAVVASGTPGRSLACQFQSASGQVKAVVLPLRQLFDGVALREDAADPGALTQGLCSPWQSDYRECGCYYWAASRPDFVNAETVQDKMNGDNWMSKQRGPAGAKQYAPDNPGDPAQWTYTDLYQNWERLRFQIGGKDES